ncbi:MAG: CNNM domain-containing protein [Chitinophagales bacterium]
MVLLVLFFVLAIGVSFLCSILEAVLLSITPRYVNQKEHEGSKIAVHLKEFKEDIDKPLSSILTLNTIAHTVGAIGVGAQASIAIKAEALHLFGLDISWEGIIAALMTLCVLILSEIIPKTIGANNWRALAPFTVRTIRILNFILLPFIWVSQLITKRLKNEKGVSVLTRTDFLMMADEIEKGGIIDVEDSKIIRNVLHWNEIPVSKIMTPRTVILAALGSDTIQSLYDAHELRHSRIPIYNKDIDGIDGYVLKDKVLESIINGKGNEPLSSIKREFLVFKRTDRVDDTFNALMDKREHIGLVLNEFGGVEGIVTLEDIMETVIGQEIVDEYDTVADMRKLAQEKAKERLK